MKSTLIVLLVASLFLSGCAKKLATSLEVDSTEAVVEGAVAVLGGAADEQAGSSYASNMRTNWKTQAILPAAFAANCSRPVYNSCIAGVKSETYINCVPGFANISLNGFVSLTYSNSTCDMSSVGSYVDREYDVTVTGVRGGSLNVSSVVKNDYVGNAYGGGGRLTTTAGGWDLSILGKHKSLIYKGNTLYDVSIRTLNPISITGSLSRAARVVSGGQLQVNHNIAKFTAVFTPVNLQWSNSCCHPVGGSLNVTLSGSKAGSATVTFQGCGQATVDENGQTRNITLSYCE